MMIRSNMRGVRILAVAWLCAGLACRSKSALDPGDMSTTLAVAGRSNAHASIAARESMVAIVWAASADAGTDIYAAVSADGGAHFGEPRRVNDTAGDAISSGEQPPRVAIGPDAVHVVWTSKRGGAAIRYARSTDTGRTFTPAVTVPAAGLRGARGWESIAVDARGVVHVAWLDGRAAAAAMLRRGNTAHRCMRTAPDGADMSGISQIEQDIYHASLTADGGVAESRVAAHVCFCCKTAVAVSAHGVYAAWRHLYPDDIRDIAFAHASDGRTFTPPTRVSTDHWQIAGCPEDGPAMVVDEAETVRIVWPTLVPGRVERKGIRRPSS